MTFRASGQLLIGWSIEGKVWMGPWPRHNSSFVFDSQVVSPHVLVIMFGNVESEKALCAGKKTLNVGGRAATSFPHGNIVGVS